MEDAVTIFGRVKPPNAGKEAKLVLESHGYIISAFGAAKRRKRGWGVSTCQPPASISDYKGNHGILTFVSVGAVTCPSKCSWTAIYTVI